MTGSRRAAPDGFIVVAVLWLVAALSVLATIYAVYVANTSTVFGMTSERLQAGALVTAGLELTVYGITAVQSRPAAGTYTFRLGRANVTTRFRTEAARVDLNVAPKPLLAGLFAGLGARGEAASDYADRIVGWRAASPDGGGEEAALYRAAGRPYAPRQAPFPHVGELWLVLGLPEALVTRALPFVTVYSGKPAVNIVAAAPEVVAGLPGMTPDRLYAVLAQRQAVAADAPLAGLLGAAAGFATTEVGNTFRVDVDVALDTGRLMRSEIVIFVDEQDAEPYRVLSWSDVSDTPASGGAR